MSDKLNSCPHVGTKCKVTNRFHRASTNMYLRKEHDNNRTYWQVVCTCGARGMETLTEEEAIAAWNKRTRTSGWISVKDRLPEYTDDAFLVYVLRDGIFFTAVGYHDIACGGWIYDCECCNKLKQFADNQAEVTHWQPLPDTPEREK